MCRLGAAMLVCVGLAFLAANSRAEEPDERRPAIRFRLPELPRYVGQVVSIEGGKVKIAASEEGPPVRDQGELAEGYYLAVVAKSANSQEVPRMLRAHVVEVGADGSAVLDQTPEVAQQLSEGYLLALFAIRGATQEALAGVPELAPVQVDRSRNRPAADSPEMLRLEASGHAREIGIALLEYEQARKRLPPAVIHGPDGRPWHSWRVLILPFVEGGAAIYDKYRLDEPWDGPDNSKLLDQMPAIYGDPVYGPSDDYYTHFAAVTGDGMAFALEGARFDGEAANAEKAARSAGRRLSEFTDGFENVIVVGSVDPKREIPWMKPEDVVVGEAFTGIGTEGGFAAPHASGTNRVGIFTFVDSMVYGISTAADAGFLRKAFSIAGGETVEDDEWRAVRSLARLSARPPGVPMLEYVEGDDGPVAVMTMVREVAEEEAAPQEEAPEADE